jgi:cytochrome c oxidase assembly protein subunit 17
LFLLGNLTAPCVMILRCVYPARRCACPITKNARDACIPVNDEDKCKYLIDAHLRCLRDEGFDV